ncbi:hypothetical protein GZ77_00615 [Endozoicomonas montiporae]|uniref:HIT domain-containing protein n=2 Tax=Endozoicomonas montiporae TaxID=1027273 RepID=A0A081N9V2_9GAMM|nr:HIT domain-containing protein [Endozoicomonas montiporae]AMO57113.1 histidine triad (HIT) protein [Endozoicomonas montiporae CL-33]KEQ15225.1 hypothetical protein GZ77_00615 [Endozoicomonas montiporae]
MEEFPLNPQLEKDCVVLGDLPLCRVLLMNDSSYPWCILVPRVTEIEELFQLVDELQIQVALESGILSRYMNDLFEADKMNVAALGNKVRQLHIHHVVRQQNDAAWPEPVWGKVPAQAYSDDELAEMREKFQPLFDRFG